MTSKLLIEGFDWTHECPRDQDAFLLDKVKSRRGEEEGRGRGGERGSPENDVTGWWLLFIEDMTEDHGVEVELS